MISKKKCIAMLPTLALIGIHRKRLDLMILDLILEVTLSARAQFTLPAHLGKIKHSHTELVFLFLLLLFFCLSLILSLLVLFLLRILRNTKKNI